mmetsp:Transcript_21000/g.49246  ORF Transcript_21000/g.49246 Transcript_21000/m.49246 type:complete len:207 (-) Transcript_21000:755-1375(-)
MPCPGSAKTTRRPRTSETRDTQIPARVWLSVHSRREADKLPESPSEAHEEAKDKEELPDKEQRPLLGLAWTRSSLLSNVPAVCQSRSEYGELQMQSEPRQVLPMRSLVFASVANSRTALPANTSSAHACICWAQNPDTNPEAARRAHIAQLQHRYLRHNTLSAMHTLETPRRGRRLRPLLTSGQHASLNVLAASEAVCVLSVDPER